MHSSRKSREGPWDFGQILMRGYLGLSENQWSPFRVLLHLYDQIFWTIPPPPGTAVCVCVDNRYKIKR